jgi:ribonuclease HI
MSDELALFELPTAPQQDGALTIDPVVVAATDGSCEPNPGTAAGAWFVSLSCWGVVAIAGEATNNVAELTAIQALLRAVPIGRRLEIVYDSEYARHSLTDWGDRWSRGGTLPPVAWRRNGGKDPVRNAELIAATRALLAGREVTWRKARAHASVEIGGHRLNQQADELARAAVLLMHQGGTPDPGPGWIK